MNLVALGRYLSGYWDIEVLKNEEAFFNLLNESVEVDNQEVFNEFMDRHGFTKDPKEIYKMIIQELTITPFFEIKATDDEYCDSYSLVGADDGQDSLEKLVEDTKYT